MPRQSGTRPPMWPWKRQVTDAARLADLAARLADLEQAFGKLQADTRAALREVSELSERAYKFLKRAEARARRELDEHPSNQEPTSGRSETPTDAPSSPRPWGARSRRLARLSRPGPLVNAARGRDHNGANNDEASDGVHS